MGSALGRPGQPEALTAANAASAETVVTETSVSGITLSNSTTAASCPVVFVSTSGAFTSGSSDGEGPTEAQAISKKALREAAHYDAVDPAEMLASVEAFAAAHRRAATVEALTAAGAMESRTPVTTYELTNGSLIERRFYAAAIEAGHQETSHASWPAEGDVGVHGTELFRDDDGALFRLDDGTVALASIRNGWAGVRVAASTREAASGSMSAFAKAYPPLYREQTDDGTVPITFWTYGRWGPQSRLRLIDAASWDAIERNYPAGVRADLARLARSFTPGQDGQLLLWQGQPGTGKTWALRALASEWRDWAEFHYITDPDAFFVSNPDYMVDVLLHETFEELLVARTDADPEVVSSTADEGKWRVLIFEDTGELLSAQAKEAYGQGLSRLLNVVDGMVGQGLRILALVTTNDELGELHPATVRPGRCAAQLEFGPLAPEEASAWLGESVDESLTLAELYQRAGRAEDAFAPLPTDECADCGHAFADHAAAGGACAMDGCDCSGFQAAASLSVEEALAAVEEFAKRMPCADCEHAYTDHLGTTGPCTADGCSCEGYGAQEAAAEVVEVAVDADLVEAVCRVGEGALALYEQRHGSRTVRFTLTDIQAADETAVLPAEHQPGERVPRRRPTPAAPQARLNTEKRWTAVLAPEGHATDDGRIFAPGSIDWREEPLTLMGMVETQEGHEGAEVCGRIDRIWRDEKAGLIRGEGVFDPGEFGSEVARMVDDRTLRGISVDIALSEVELARRSQVVDEDGNWIEGQDEAAADQSAPDPFFPDEPLIFVVHKGKIGAATVCPFPAFAEASISVAASLVAAANPFVWTATGPGGWAVTEAPCKALTASLTAAEPQTRGITRAGALTASAAGIAPEQPPASWFDPPDLDELTALVVDDDGRVYGHAAGWGTCHLGFPGQCVTPPHSNTDYDLFHLKEVVCDDGSRVPVGTITLQAPHAELSLGAKAATAHYDNTGWAVADVRVGEDEHGIWVAGALRPSADAEKARELRGAVLSGDWRPVDGNRELVGLLAVNVPGFPIPRPRALVAAGGEVGALVAAGIHKDGQLLYETDRAA